MKLQLLRRNSPRFYAIPSENLLNTEVTEVTKAILDSLCSRSSRFVILKAA